MSSHPDCFPFSVDPTDIRYSRCDGHWRCMCERIDVTPEERAQADRLMEVRFDTLQRAYALPMDHEARGIMFSDANALLHQAYKLTRYSW